MKYSYFLFSLFSGKKWEMGRRLLYKRWSSISHLLCVLMEKVTSLFFFALVICFLSRLICLFSYGQLIYNHCLSCSSLNLKISFLVWGWVNELGVVHRLCQDHDILIKPHKVKSDHMAAQPAQFGDSVILGWNSPRRNEPAQLTKSARCLLLFHLSLNDDNECNS